MEGWSCRLVRGGEELGVVTHDLGDGPWNVGHLEPAPGYTAARPLFEREQRVFDRLLEIELAPGYGTDLAAEAARLRLEAELVQGEILMPGVQMVLLDNSEVYLVDELHLEGLKLYWR